ncbi:ROK family glucokinase [Ornithinimicrobium cryptoxanthini]|uniref:ROK family glucokinase n=1 Tax=Ornithinimicrobium cryptoxanthini TaxID=2934161 RepID=UPI0021198082|nr:ROK family glucokinase [Ornithinimicrobium cryptoxanthini]
MGLNIGIDVGGTKIAGATVDVDGQIHHRSRRETPAQDVDAMSATITDLVHDLLRAADADGRTVGAVGVAVAGFVDASGTTVLFAPNIAWRDAPLKRMLEETVGRPIILENDANAAAWGEFRFGPARDDDDMLLLTVGTGVGGGIVSDGELLRGHEGVAAEVGHLRVQPDGYRCGCGNKGCLEAYASGTALVREARELVRGGSPHAGALIDLCGGDPEQLTGEMVTQAAAGGDPAAVELLADLGTWLGEGIASLVAVLDPAVIVVGGGVADAGDLLVGPARAAFGRQLTGRGHRRQADIVLAELGNDAGMIGVADLASRRTAPADRALASARATEADDARRTDAGSPAPA